MKLLRWVPLCFLAMPLSANAATYVLNTTSGGYTYKAKADFTYSGSILTVVLKNTQNSNVNAASNGQVLTGLFWNLNKSVTGTPTASSGSSQYVDGNGNLMAGPPSGQTAGKNWAYKAAVPNWGGGTNFGVGAIGANFFSPNDRFETGGNNLNGDNWGLLGGNWSIGGNQTPFIVSAMTFTFDVGTSFNLASISNVWFQYGSNFSGFRAQGDEPLPPTEAVPEPASMAMAAFAAAAAWRGRRKLRNSKA